MAKNPSPGPQDPHSPHKPADAGAGPQAAPPSAADSDEFDDLDRTLQSADLPPDVMKTMTAAWLGAFDPQTPPRVTVKGNLPPELLSPGGETGAEPDAHGTWDEAAVGPMDQTYQFEDAVQRPPGEPTIELDSDGSNQTTWNEEGVADEESDRTLASDEFAPTDPAAADRSAGTAADDARGEQTFASDEFPPTGPVDETPAPGAPTWSDDHDSTEQTFASDEFPPTGPVDETPAPGAPTWSDDHDSTDQTFVSDEFAPVSEAGGPDESGPTWNEDDSVDKTFISDEFQAVEPADDSGSVPDLGPTLASGSLGSAPADDSAEQTFLSDEFTPAAGTPRADGSGEFDNRTEPLAGPTNDGGGTLGEDSVDRTFISDDFGPPAGETLDSGAGGVPARKTSPEQGRTADELAETGLVIKARRFRQMGEQGRFEAEYEVVKKLGEGGMGVVYDARQTSIDRSVAVKMLKVKGAKSEQQQLSAKQKFLAEAVVTGELDHPNIVPIYDVGRTDDQSLFYSMKHVEGTPWLDVIAQKSDHENIEILMRVADAVAFAHDRGVVHRDLKPENVMLGGYGEVLLMDWGLALPTAKFRKGGSVTRSNSMGGTPAYMAPEMATGPLEKIGAWSDIYLLGAILYEIVTGHPPHKGKNAMKCLMAAAKNEVVPTDKTGELVDVARKAMATDPKDRHASVQEFQGAIRDYLSHSESVLLTARADEDLERAERTDNYTDYQQSVFGFNEAYELWSGNTRAKNRLTEARLAYARSAYRKGDYDLAAGMLDLGHKNHAALHRDIQTAITEREGRQRRLKTAKRVGAVLVATILIVISGAAVWINNERTKAVAAQAEAETQRGKAVENLVLAEEQRKEAEEQRKKAEANFLLAEEQRKKAETNFALAEEQRKEADDQRQKAIANAMLAEQERKKAEANATLAEEQRKKAETNFALAEEQRKEADDQRQKAVANAMLAEQERKKAEANATLAEERRQEAETNLLLAEERRKEANEQRDLAAYEAYIAQIGLAAAKIDENAFDSALGILEEVEREQPELVNWEWARLKWLCSQNVDQADVGARVESLAVSPDGTKFVVGGWDGLAEIRNAQSEDMETLRTLDHGAGVRVLSVAFSPDGRKVATGSDDNLARVWDLETGEATVVRGHTDQVISVAFSFSGNGQWLLTGSLDMTAGLWDAKTGEPIRKFRGHYDPVLAVAFCPNRDEAGAYRDEIRLVTADLRGNAVVWTETEPRRRWQPTTSARADDTVKVSSPFRGHEGPIYSAAFSPDGRLVATASYDRRILLWDPDKIVADNLDNLRKGSDVMAPPVIEKSLEGHAGPVRSVTFFSEPDRGSGGYWLLSGGNDNTLRVWNVRMDDPARTARPLRTFRGHGSTVLSAVFSPQGRWILSGSYDQQVKKWSLEGKQEIRVLQSRAFRDHQDAVLAVAFSRDGQRVVTASADKTAKTWNLLEAAQPPETFEEGHEYLPSAAVITPNGEYLITAAGFDATRVWDFSTGTELRALGGTGSSTALALTPDGRWVITGSVDRTAMIWDLEQLIVAPQHQLPEPIRLENGHEAAITAAAVSDDGRLIATADLKGRVVVWQWDAANREARLRNRFDSHVRKVVGLAFVPGTHHLLSASQDYTVKHWDLDAHREVPEKTLKHGDSLRSLAVSPDGQLALTSCDDGTVRLWQIDSGREVARLASRSEPRAGEKAPLWNSVAFDEQGRFALAVDSQNGRITFWDVQSRKQVETVEDKDTLLWSGDFVPTGRQSRDRLQFLTVGGNGARLWENSSVLLNYRPQNEVASARFSPDARYLATGSWDNTVRIWDTRTGKAVLKLEGPDGHTGHVNSAEFIPTGRSDRVLTAGDDGQVKLWKIDWDTLDQPEVVWSFPPDGVRTGELRMLQATFSPDAKLVGVAASNGVAYLLDAENGRPLGRLEGHDPIQAVLCIAFSRDGQRILTGSEDLTAIMWDVPTRKPLLTMEGHTAGVASVAFSPDGRRALTGSRDTTVKLWDTAVRDQQREAKEILTLKQHDREVTSVAFSPDGQQALTGSRDGTAILWLAAPFEPHVEPVEAPIPALAGTAAE